MHRLALALALIGIASVTLSIVIPGEELVVHTASVHLPVVETDKFKVKGSLADLSLEGVGGIYFELGPIDGSIPIDWFRVVEDKYIFEDAQGPIAKLVLDPATERFTATGRDLFLNDLANPVAMRLVVGASEFCTMLLFDERDGRWRFHESEDPQLLCGLPEAPLASPAGVLVATPTEVKVTIAVPADSGVDPTSLELAEVDADLVPVVAPLCFPVDDGEETSGDDAAGDGVYTCRVDMDEDTPRTLRLAVQGLEGGLGVVSPVLELEVVAALTPAQIDAALAAADAAAVIWEDALAQFGDPAAAASVAAAAIAGLGGVNAAGLTSEGSSIWIEFATGIEGTIPVDPFLLGEPESGTGSPAASATADDATRLRSWAAEPTAPRAAAAEGWNADWIGNASVLEIGLEDTDHLPPTVFGDIFGASACQRFVVSRVGFPEELDAIERFRENLVSGHGTLLIDGSGSLSRGGEVQLWLDAPVTAPSVTTHLLDLRTGGLGISWQNSRLRWIYAVRPSFILTLPRRFDRALVVVDADYSAANHTMASAFGRKGAGAYLGFDRAVGLFFRFAVMDQFLTQLTERESFGQPKTVGQSWAAVDPLIDPESPHTRFLGWGSTNLAYHCPDLSFDAVSISISTINTYRTQWWDNTVSETTRPGNVSFGEDGQVLGRRFIVDLPEAYVAIDLDDNAEEITTLEASDVLELSTTYHASAARAYDIPLVQIDARGFRTFRVTGPAVCEHLEKLEDVQKDIWMIQTIVPPPSAPDKAALCDENSEIEVEFTRE